jgi:putative aldouronate transport system permease protein
MDTHLESSAAIPMRSAKQRSLRSIIGRGLIHTTLMTLSVIFIAPLLLVIAASLSSETAISRYGYSFIPRDFTLYAYRYILSNPTQIIDAYGVTITVTVIGTSLGVLIMALLAYPLARYDFFLRRPFSFYVFFTLLFNGGLVPLYILITQYLHLQGTLFVLISSSPGMSCFCVPISPPFHAI